MPDIKNILDLTGKYMPEENLKLISRAYDYALKVYADSPVRKSGDPYITHPLSVAEILATMQLDVHAIISGLLHKALRGKPLKSSIEELTELFGKDVAAIVSGATRIDDIQFHSRLDYKAENVKKMLLAMSTDIRVLLVKLADHLHDMKTLHNVNKTAQKELAQDTRDLYAPLASRLGIDWIKRELEDLSFQYLYPDEFADLTSKIEMSAQEREEFVEEIKAIMQKTLQEEGLTGFKILGRPKHLYSIYRKLIAQNISIDKVYDKVAFRVIVNTVSECYEVMGIVHALWKPIASRFKDFISTPKANLYQSLHTSVVGPHGDFMEIQIRTEEMDEIANDGIAAHWAYKEGTEVSKKDARLFHWLKQLVQSLHEVDDSAEFLDAVKVELDYSDVYALTPGGEVKELPSGSTPLDFAYSIHTEVGHHCTGAKVNGRIVPLKYKLQNGEVVEIITSPSQNPNQGWLRIVKTSRAKSRIRHWLNLEEQEQLLERGREICERELRKHSLSLKRIIKTGHLKNVLKNLSCNTLDDLLHRVGSGKISTQVLDDQFEPPEVKEERARIKAELEAKALEDAPILRGQRRRKSRRSVVKIDGIDDVLIKISNCCMPMPGDDIGGFITAGRGVSIHKSDCPNFRSSDPARQVAADWVEQEQGTHKAKVRVLAHDSKGLIVSLCNVVNADDTEILDLEAHVTKPDQLAKINLILGVTGKKHLTAVIQKIKQMKGVLEASRY